ncbi:putative repeat protein (TIGR02543 family) [Mobilisporobacter senegalensis]|uniref:Putative repeat protein (TIGR02543 family) n=1 Tax=Mobilisporobacter senegalensis TaxID=1329262 RepID=A0A3N1XJU7_9FIRM|nr:InlB B-repeat-containing protein [Mobilisporobacter senegalensis]ROR25332.1 putative repeat protein (TIGR02543 family) [Mobilisporobacter senegalensis]
MMTRKKRLIICIIAILFMIFINFEDTRVSAGTSETKNIRVTGDIYYYIKENGNNEANSVRKLLNNYPLVLYYEDSKGNEYWKNCYTDSRGSFDVPLDRTNIKKVWVVINAENEACNVTRKVGIGNRGYSYKSKKQTVSSKQKTVNLKVNIDNQNAKGAINIARVINNARNFMKNETGINVGKINVFWTYGKGIDSYTNSVARYGMVLAGKDHDERDESVICHEYGHWVYGTIRNSGSFMGGNHSSENRIDIKLAYSEGLATFFGQSALGSARYYDGNNVLATSNYSIESPHAKIPKSRRNEAYVAASQWDTIDGYPDNTEDWDKVDESIKNVLNTNRDVVLEAGFIPFDIDDIENTFMVYDCTIEDFYNKYIENHIKKNSNEAYEFWNIFNKNGMQFDKAKPKITLNGQGKNAFITVNDNVSNFYIELYDNVKVSKVEFWINGKAVGKFTNPADNFNYVIPKEMLKDGLNKLAIKAYDYAKNVKTYDNKISKQFPAKDFFKASNDNNNYSNMAYRQPYAIEFVDLYVEKDISGVSTFSLNPFMDLNEESGISNSSFSDSIIDELADTYSLSYKNELFGSLDEGHVSEENEITISSGNDYGILIDDTLGDFEIILKDPRGKIYTNIESEDELDTEVNPENESVNELETQYVLNMGSSGFMLFNPIPGTWKISIKNCGTDSDYYVGIYTRLSAPIIHNEEELLKIQDGSSVELRASVATGSSISVTSGSAISVPAGSELSVVTGGAVSITLTGESSGIKIQDLIYDTFDQAGNFTYTFKDLPDDHYKVELYLISEDGSTSWIKECDLIVDSTIPDILLEEDYEYYIYPGYAIIEGTGINSSNVSVFVNGTAVAIYGCKDDGNDINFATDKMILNKGENRVLIIAETETGRKAEKELILYSELEEDCFTEEHQPIIESVLFDGKEEPLINKNSTIDLKLTDSNVENYKVYAICNDKIYNFIPNGDHFTLNYTPEEGSGNYLFSIYAVSKWLMYDYKEIELTVHSDDSGIYIIKQPDDINIKLGETATLNLDEIFGGADFSVESDIGNITNQVWEFKPAEEGVVEVNLKAIQGEKEITVSFYVIVEDSLGFNLKLDANGGEMEENECYVNYGESYGLLPTPVRKDYTFLGWFTEADGGTQVFPTTMVNEGDTQILFAHWKINGPIVYFDATGGNVIQDFKIVSTGSLYGALPIPTRINYTFAGWYTQATGGTLITANSKVNFTTAQTLYARWTGNNYQVTLNANGGLVSGKASVSANVIYGNTYGNLLVTPTKAGYEFIGWFTEIDGGTQITASDIVNTTEKQTLYAHWKERSFVVYFQGNGGTVPVSNKTVVYKSTYGELPIPIRANYIFQGWYTSTVGGTKITEESIMTATSSHYIYAQWLGEPHTVTFDANGGEVSQNSMTVTYGSPYGTMPTPTRTGYRFVGWSTQANSANIVNSGNPVNIAKDQILYAYWVGNNYQVTLNANGGLVSGKASVNVNVIYKNTYGSSLVTPTKAGYEFVGWFTEVEGGTQITTSSIVDFIGSKTLYAHWKEGSFKVTFNANGGSVQTSSKNVIYGSTYGELPIPTRANYIFQGWYTNTVGGTKITEDSIVTITGATSLYAQWIGETYEVLFDANGGSISQNNMNVIYGNTYGTLPIPTRTNYTFAGWYTQATGGTQIVASSKVNIASTQTLYARWTGNNYQVTLNANGGLVSGKASVNVNVIYKNTYGSSLVTPTKAGYEFLGWFTEVNGGIQITASSIVEFIGSQTLYAHWKEGSFKIIFNANGGSVQTNNKNVIYGSTYGELPIPVRANYIFQGWYTNTVGGIKITEDSVVAITGAIPLYAQWIGETYEVLFDANGGSISQNNINVIYGNTYGTLPIPTRTNYTFAGWYTQAVGGTQIVASSKVDFTSTQTLYAHWTGKNYTVILDANGGLVSGKTNISTNVIYGNTYGGSLIAPTKAGYEFLGWFTEINDGLQITASSIVDFIGSQTLYAHWKEGSFKVTFNANGGSVQPSSKSVIYKSVYGELPIPIRSNYIFQGWYTNTVGGTKITEDSVVTITGAISLYAQWVGETHKVTFDANGGEVSQNSITVTYGSPYGAMPTPTRTGYRFYGWSTQANSASIVGSGNTVNITKDQTLYAYWIGNNYPIILDANGGLVSKAASITTSVIYGNTYGNSLITPTKAGYEFLGWFTEIDGGIQITTSSIVNTTEKQTLYAHWKEGSFVVYFQGNGGTVPVSNKTVVYKSTYGELPTPIRANYIFQGWYTSTVGGTRITEESIMTATSSHYIYAQWVGEPHTVTFDANGGEVSQNSMNVIYGSPYGTMPTPTRTGYRFYGWSTQANSASIVGSGNTVTITKDQTLYAYWIGNNYLITLDANGGLVSKAASITTSVIYGNTYGSSLITPTKAGYEFVGWFTEIDGGTQITASSIVNTTEKQTLYAHWKEGSFVVYFQGNGGTVPVSNKTVVYKSTYGELPTPIRANYIFQGWYTSTVGGTRITEESIMTATSSHYIYAQWVGEPHTVTFDANGGEVSQNSMNVIYGSPYGTMPTPTRTGYRFYGWSTQANSASIVGSGNTVTITKDQTLYAYWIGNNYLITLDANGGLVSKAASITTSVIYGNPYGSSLITPTKAGYEFLGWFTEIDGGTQITASNIVNTTEKQTLYAHWKEGSFTVNFYGNGGTVPISNKIVVYKSAYGELPIPTRTNYVFQGWYTSTVGGTRITEDSIMTVTGSHTIYAQWVGETHTVTFDANGGEVSQNSMNVIYGSPYGAMPTPTKTGYRFVGWSLQSNGSNTVSSGSIVNITKDQTLYAYWSANYYPVILDANGGKIKSGNTYVNTQTVYATYGNSYGSVLPIPVKAGNIFEGWYTKVDGGIEVKTSDIVDITQEYKLYAHWNPIKSKISFDANEGSVSISNKEVTYGETYGYLPTPVRRNYNFLGWYTYGGAKIEDSTLVSITSAMTLTAKWIGIDSNVTFNGNGGSVPSQSMNVYYGSKYGTLPTPTREGYNFDGWYTYNGQKITFDTIVEITNDQTLYAHWTIKTLTIYFITNGGVLPASTQIVNYGDYYSLPTPTKNGYVFLGWFKSSNEQVTSDTRVKISGSIYLYAYWGS